jgi:hypothetical protein
MDLKTISKETQSTIEQIQRWIKSFKKNISKYFFKHFLYLVDINTNRDPYPFAGVIEALRGKNNFCFFLSIII